MWPDRLSEATSENWMFSVPWAAQPPLLENSCKRSSLAHTSTLRTERELLRTPIMMVRTSPSDGLPITLTLFFWSEGSYSE